MSYGDDSFVWDGGGALSSKAKAQKLRDRSEKIAQMLMEQQGGATDTSPVGHWTQGAARVADALFGAIQRGRDEKAASGYNAQADKIDAAGRAQSAKTFSPLHDFLSGGVAAKPTSYLQNQIGQNPLDGTALIADKQGGSRSWRNNNPGNIEYGDFAQSSGATGTDGRFAVFPSYEAGRSAQEKLLFDSKNYRDLPLSKAIARWAPSSENNVPAYLSAVGGNPSMRMQDFTPSQRAEILNNMQKHEGWRAGKSAPLNQVASNDPTFMPASAPPQDSAINAMPPLLQQPTQAPQMPQEAQAQEPAPQAPQPSNMPTAAQLMAVMSDEYASDTQKFAAKQMLDHVMQLDPRLQDPLERQNKQLQIEQAKGNLKKQPLELYQLEQNIKLARTKEDREAALFQYDKALKQGQIDKQPIEIDQAKANLANTGKTGAIQEYEYSQKNPNFKVGSGMAGEATSDQKNYNFAIQQLKERGVPDDKLPTFQEWAKPKSRGISFKSADGTEIQIGGDAAGDSGLQGTSIPAEVGARIGLGQEFLQKDYPDIINMIKAGDATGPIDYAAGYMGRGNSGIVQRRMATGVDALRRGLTGAGMSASETNEYVGRYSPSMTDDPETLTRKAKGLKQDLEAVANGSIRGKAGDVNSLLPKNNTTKVLKYNPETGDFE
jgi:hypothetical protein